MQVSLNKFAYRNSKNLKGIDIFAFISFMLTGILGIVFESSVMLLISCCLEIISIGISMLRKLNKFVTSLRNFILYGFWVEVILSTMTTILIGKFVDLLGENTDNIIPYIFIIMLIFIWLFISLIVNNDIAKIVNLILASFSGIILALKDFLILCLPDVDVETMAYGLSYTYKQGLELIISVVVTPFLITNIIATLLCEIKSYWIKKYNNGIDITMELIKKEVYKRLP